MRFIGMNQEFPSVYSAFLHYPSVQDLRAREQTGEIPLTHLERHLQDRVLVMDFSADLPCYTGHVCNSLSTWASTILCTRVFLLILGIGLDSRKRQP